jgi:hypothetical protein
MNSDWSDHIHVDHIYMAAHLTTGDWSDDDILCNGSEEEDSDTDW